MDQMSNLRVLNDYLNQTIDILVRQPRAGQPGFSASPFAPIPGGFGTDTVHGAWYASMAQQAPFATTSATPGFPGYGVGSGLDPLLAQRTYGQPFYGQASYGQPTYGQPFYGQPSYGQPTFGQTAFGQPTFAPMSYTSSVASSQPWNPAFEAQRQAQINQALCAKQSVLEAMCRACGIPC